MSMQSFGECPWCGARIDLQKVGRVCVCPVCACKFTRNPAKWKVGVPVAMLVAVLLWFFVPRLSVFATYLVAGLGAIGVLIFTAGTSHHTIVEGGRTDLTTGEAKRHKAKGHESKWFIVGVGLLLVAALFLIVLALLARR